MMALSVHAARQILFELKHWFFFLLLHKLLLSRMGLAAACLHKNVLLFFNIIYTQAQINNGRTTKTNSREYYNVYRMYRERDKIIIKNKKKKQQRTFIQIELRILLGYIMNVCVCVFNDKQYNQNLPINIDPTCQRRRRFIILLTRTRAYVILRILILIIRYYAFDAIINCICQYSFSLYTIYMLYTYVK